MATTLGEAVEWGNDDLFTHLLIIGPTRCGKTSNLLKPMVYQLLKLKKQGVPLGLSVVEPKGDVAMMVREMCEVMEIDMIHIDPTRADTANFNPMKGEENDVAEATVIVLKGLFGKQDAFFATVQELSARNVTKLLKRLRGDDMSIVDVMVALREPEVLEQHVAELAEIYGEGDDLVSFFQNELLGTMKDKFAQFVIGLRAQLENIVSNKALRAIMTGESVLDIDEHFEKGGILAVNTALGMLRSSGDAFGQFIIMHLQNGTFRRKGTERTRVPHFIIVDEYSRYINPDVEIFLSLAAEYRVSGIFAAQSLGQLAIESGKLSGTEMKRSILASCRNKITFGGLTFEDAQDFANEFGKDRIIKRQSTYKNNVLIPNLIADSYRDTETEEYRFTPTDLQNGIPRFHYIHSMLKDGTPQIPSIAKGEFLPRDWKERREWEKGAEQYNLDEDVEAAIAEFPFWQRITASQRDALREEVKEEINEINKEKEEIAQREASERQRHAARYGVDYENLESHIDEYGIKRYVNTETGEIVGDTVTPMDMPTPTYEQVAPTSTRKPSKPSNKPNTNRPPSQPNQQVSTGREGNGGKSIEDIKRENEEFERQARLKREQLFGKKSTTQNTEQPTTQPMYDLPSLDDMGEILDSTDTDNANGNESETAIETPRAWNEDAVNSNVVISDDKEKRTAQQRNQEAKAKREEIERIKRRQKDDADRMAENERKKRNEQKQRPSAVSKKETETVGLQFEDNSDEIDSLEEDSSATSLLKY